MPEGCCVTPCRECKFHVVTGARLDCNWMNRLGLKGSKVEQFGSIPDEEMVQRKIEAKKEELDKLEKSRKELAKVKSQLEETKS